MFALGRRTLTSSNRSAGVITEIGRVPEPPHPPSTAGENPVSCREVASETLTMFLKSDSDRVDKARDRNQFLPPIGKCLVGADQWFHARRPAVTRQIQRSANPASPIGCRYGER